MTRFIVALLLSATPALAQTQRDVVQERERCVSAASAKYFATVRETGDVDGANKQLAEDDADCAAAQDEAMDKIRAEQGRRMIEACRANPNDPRYYCQNVLK